MSENSSKITDTYTITVKFQRFTENEDDTILERRKELLDLLADEDVDGDPDNIDFTSESQEKWARMLVQYDIAEDAPVTPMERVLFFIIELNDVMDEHDLLRGLFQVKSVPWVDDISAEEEDAYTALLELEQERFCKENNLMPTAEETEAPHPILEAFAKAGAEPFIFLGAPKTKNVDLFSSWVEEQGEQDLQALTEVATKILATNT